MKPVSALTDFLEQAANDGRLSMMHISLFAAIFHLSAGEVGDFFPLSRKKLMRFSKTRSIATYPKRLRELVNYGYSVYEPFYHPVKGSQMAIVGS